MVPGHVTDVALPTAADFWSVGRPEPRQMPVASLTHVPPETITFRSQLEAAPCPTGNDARAPASQKLLRCAAKLEKRSGKRQQQIERLRAAGKTVEADEMQAELTDRLARDREAQCAKIAVAAANAFQEAYSELVGELANIRYQDPIDRAALIRSAIDARVFAAENAKVN